MDEAMSKLEAQLQRSDNAAVAVDTSSDASATGSQTCECASAVTVGAGNEEQLDVQVQEEDYVLTDQELIMGVEELADTVQLYVEFAEGASLEAPEYQPLWDSMGRYNVRCKAVHEQLLERRAANSKQRKSVRFADEEDGELRSGKLREAAAAAAVGHSA
jgi:hypothetical protein